MISRVCRDGDRVITRMLVSVAIVFGSGALGAAPGNADPTPFNTLGCNCPEKAAPGSQARRDEITQGLRRGMSAWSPRPPHNPTQATRG